MHTIILKLKKYPNEMVLVLHENNISEFYLLRYADFFHVFQRTVVMAYFLKKYGADGWEWYTKAWITLYNDRGQNFAILESFDLCFLLAKHVNFK